MNLTHIIHEINTRGFQIQRIQRSIAKSSIREYDADRDLEQTCTMLLNYFDGTFQETRQLVLVRTLMESGVSYDDAHEIMRRIMR